MDDEPDIRDMMAAPLAFYGFQTSMATSGSAALEHMRRQRPPVVLLDLTMPVMDGCRFREDRQKDAHQRPNRGQR